MIVLFLIIAIYAWYRFLLALNDWGHAQEPFLKERKDKIRRKINQHRVRRLERNMIDLIHETRKVNEKIERLKKG